MPRFAETRLASLFRTFPQRSATLSPGSSARWRLFLCQGWSLLIEMRYFITQSFVSDWSRSPTASKCPRRFASTSRPTPRRFNNHRLNIVSPLQKMLRCWSRWWRSGATSHLTSRPPQQDLLLGSSSQTRYYDKETFSLRISNVMTKGWDNIKELIPSYGLNMILKTNVEIFS